MGESQGSPAHTLAVASAPGASYPLGGPRRRREHRQRRQAHRPPPLLLADARRIDARLHPVPQQPDELRRRARRGLDLDLRLLHQRPHEQPRGPLGRRAQRPVRGVQLGRRGRRPPWAAARRCSRTWTTRRSAWRGGTTYAPPAGIHDTLQQNPDGTWLLVKTDGTSFFFNAAGYLAQIADRNANTLVLTLNSGGYVTKITDPTGRAVTIALTSGNRFTSVTDMDNRTWSFGLNGAGDLSSVTWPDPGDGHAYTDGFAYDGSHRITTHTDRRGKAWTFGYNADGSLASETDPLGNATTYGYASGATTVTDALGHAMTDNYASGVVASHVDASGFSTSYTARDANYDPTAWTDARGKAWSATYDGLGNVLSRTDPLGPRHELDVQRLRGDRDGHRRPWPRDHHRVRRVRQRDRRHERARQDDPDQRRGQLRPDLQLDGRGGQDDDVRLLRERRPQGHDRPHGPGYTWRTVDDRGNTTATIDGQSDVTYVDFDGWDRRTSVTPPAPDNNPLTTSTTWYLPTGQPVKTMDELGHTTVSGYDDAGRLASFANGNGDTETYGYDAASRRTSVTNGRGKARTYGLTARGDVSSLTMPDGAVQSWSYDGAGNATATVNPLGQTITTGYDDAARETGMTYPSGTATGFGYDAADRRTSMTDATGTTTWAYDAANRPTTFGSPAGSQTSGYDDAGHRTSLAGTGISRSWTYDGAGRALTAVNEQNETTTYGYDSDGRLSTTTLANGQVSTLGYDARSRQTSVTHRASASGATLSSESYAYDRAGNLTSKAVDGTTTSYGYDAADQLTSESAPGYSASYAYDANGNPHVQDPERRDAELRDRRRRQADRDHAGRDHGEVVHVRRGGAHQDGDHLGGHHDPGVRLRGPGDLGLGTGRLGYLHVQRPGRPRGQGRLVGHERVPARRRGSHVSRALGRRGGLHAGRLAAARRRDDLRPARPTGQRGQADGIRGERDRHADLRRVRHAPRLDGRASGAVRLRGDERLPGGRRHGAQAPRAPLLRSQHGAFPHARPSQGRS